MEKIRSATFAAKIWMVHGTAVVSIPRNEVKAGKFKKGQLVETSIQTIS